ncbi:MAG: anhydro-N-acetylmuramic acid kinase [Pseudomonadota bacterium]
MRPARLFIGMISGTSADGIDSALIREEDDQWQIVHATTVPLETTVVTALSDALAHPDQLSAAQAGALDAQLGDAFADAALQTLSEAKIAPEDVVAIGSHGQTLFHAPDAKPSFTMQVGDGARIAARTGITTINDFRRADIAVGGQGAPLAPLLHQHWFHTPGRRRVIINLGGISNVTVLDGEDLILGFDTGPANTLMDTWARWIGLGDYDANGALAASAPPDFALLETLLTDPYLHRPPPKSTGREHYSGVWLAEHLGVDAAAATSLPPERQAVIMSTLAAFTCESIRRALHAIDCEPDELVICGGGAANTALMDRLAATFAPCPVASSAAIGVDPNFVEAALFGWLAACYIDEQPIDTTCVTGARQPVIAGCLHKPPGVLQS